MASRVVLSQSKLKLHRHRQRLFIIWLVTVLLVIVIGGSIALLWLPEWRITTVGVVGTQTLSPGAITDVVHDDLAGTYAYLFPKNNILLYPKGTIVRDLSTAFPVLSHTSLKLQNLHTLTVTITERTPIALWCGEEMASGTPCYLLDTNGLAYARASQYASSTYTQYYGPIATGTLPWQYLSGPQFQSLAALAQAVNGVVKGDSVTTVTVTADGEVQMGFGSGFVLLFLLSQNSSDILNRFSLALTADPFTSHTLSQVEYLDLRFGDKLYYKLK